MKVALPKSRWSYLVSALLAVGFASQSVAALVVEPCWTGSCEIILNGTTVRVEPSMPRVVDGGDGYRAKYQPYPIPLNGGMTQWQIAGRNVMFSESFFYRIGPAAPGNPERYWVDSTSPLSGTQSVWAEQNRARIAATTEGGLSLPGGVKLDAVYDIFNGGLLINEKLQVKNTTDAPMTVTLFAYTDLDISQTGIGDMAIGRLGIGNANVLQTDETGHVKVKVTGIGASGFELKSRVGRTVERGGEPSLLDLLNRPELEADFLNMNPEYMLSPDDVTYVMQWSNIELPAFGSREIALVKEFSVPEPASLALLMAPLLAGLGLRRGKRRA